MQCKLCLKKKNFLLFSYKSFPLVTVNNYKNKNKKFVNFNINFCLHCKNIFFKQFNYCKILYKNYSNKRYEYQKKLFIQNLIDEKIIVFNNRLKTKLLCIGKNIFSIKKNIKHRILINYATPFVGKKNINYYLKNKKKINNFHYIVLFNFFGNLENLNLLLKIIKKNHNAEIIIYSHYGPSVLQKNLLHFLYPEHINNPSITAIQIFLKRASFGIKKIKFYENKTFFRIIAKKNSMLKNKLIKKTITNEKLLTLKKIKQFKKKITLYKKNININLKKISKKFQVLALGSSISSYPLFFILNLSKHIKIVLDDYPICDYIELVNKKIKIIKTNKINLNLKKIYILNLILRQSKKINIKFLDCKNIKVYNVLKNLNF